MPACLLSDSVLIGSAGAGSGAGAAASESVNAAFTAFLAARAFTAALRILFGTMFGLLELGTPTLCRTAALALARFLLNGSRGTVERIAATFAFNAAF